MTSMIRAACPDCGEVTLTPDDLTLVHLEASVDFRFCCPRCMITLQRRATEAILRVLRSSGVREVNEVPLSEEEVARMAQAIHEAADLVALLG